MNMANVMKGKLKWLSDPNAAGSVWSRRTGSRLSYSRFRQSLKTFWSVELKRSVNPPFSGHFRNPLTCIGHCYVWYSKYLNSSRPSGISSFWTTVVEQPSVQARTVWPYPSSVPPGVKNVFVWLTEIPALSDFLCLVCQSSSLTYLGCGVLNHHFKMSYSLLLRLQNDLRCVEWGVKLYSLPYSLHAYMLAFH